jgi:hypothetical protein
MIARCKPPILILTSLPPGTDASVIRLLPCKGLKPKPTPESEIVKATHTPINTNHMSSLSFAANGVVYIFDLGCLESKDQEWPSVSCLLSGTGMAATLQSPIELSPLMPNFPYEAYYTPERCVDRSGTPSWEVADFFYDHTEPRLDSPESGPYYPLSLNLTNFSTGERLICLAKINDTVFSSTYVEQWFECQLPTPSSSQPRTAVMFDVEYNLLGVRQSWDCDDAIEDIEEYTDLSYPSRSLAGLRCRV